MQSVLTGHVLLLLFDTMIHFDIVTVMATSTDGQPPCTFSAADAITISFPHTIGRSCMQIAGKTGDEPPNRELASHPLMQGANRAPPSARTSRFSTCNAFSHDAATHPRMYCRGAGGAIMSLVRWLPVVRLPSKSAQVSRLTKMPRRPLWHNCHVRAHGLVQSPRVRHHGLRAGHRHVRLWSAPHLRLWLSTHDVRFDSCLRGYCSTHRHYTTVGCDLHTP